MSVVPRHRGIAFTAVAVLLATAVLLLSSPPTASTGSASGPRALVNLDPCPGAMLPHNYTGTVTLVGGGSPATVPLTYHYEAVVTKNTTTGTILSSVCSLQNATVAPDGNGAFAFSVYPNPSTNCTLGTGSLPGKCVVMSGPYLAVNLTAEPIPSGDFSTVAQNGTAFQVGVYPYLSSVRLSPAPPSATFSPGAVDGFAAQALTGAGNVTPRFVQFEWTLGGTGWTFVGSPNGSAVNLSAAAGAAIGNLSVIATTSVNGTVLTTPAVNVQLLAVPTAIASASFNRTVLDVGQSVVARINGSGAPGYTYAATVTPGLGGAAVPGACVAVPALDGTVAFSCTETVIYTAPGVAQPVVTVTNGASAAVWQFPEVTVDPLPELALLPGAPVGYVNETVPIVVQAGTGSGTLPYVEACLSSGIGAPQCTRSAGPSWTFEPVYHAPGRYSISAWTIDATGSNRSVTSYVEVVASLTVRLASYPTIGTAGAPLALAAVISGGALPGRVWWNATGASNPIASAPVTTDGPVSATFVPLSAGFVTVSVAVVDGRGSLATVVATWMIGVGAASAAVPVVLPPTSPVPAGTPFSVAWQAFDSGGDIVRDFASVAEIELVVGGTPATAPGWVNASGVGPLVSRLPGWFDVPATAWEGGELNVSVTSRWSGSIQVELVVAAGLRSGSGTIGADVVPDIQHLRLFDPETARDGVRSNDTLWQVSDRFGNPATGASVVVTTSFEGSTEATVTPVLSLEDGGTVVWVNFSAPGPWAGTVTVTDLAGEALLPPIAVPGLAGPWATLGAVPLVLAIGVGVGSGGVALGRGRSRRSEGAHAPADEEDELQRLAEGRATVIEVLSPQIARVSVSRPMASVPSR